MLFHKKPFILFFLFLLGPHSILMGDNYVAEDNFFESFLLPEDHPVKQKLDKLFSESRVSLNLESLAKAKFEQTELRRTTKIVVTKHPSIPGFVFKLYLDSQNEFVEGAELGILIRRIEGANIVRNIIAEYSLGSLFCVPQKWIYMIPSHHLPPSGYIQRRYLLVAEDMNIYTKSKNKKIWKSEKVTYNLLDKLYLILKKSCLSDGAKVSNIPFSFDGRIAFIDTQNYGYPIVYYERLSSSLTKKNKTYWESMTQ